MEKYTVVKVFLDECNAHPEWNKSEISQTLLDEIENLIDNATRLEKALDKACRELDFYSRGPYEEPIIDVDWTVDQWKEWCVG